MGQKESNFLSFLRLVRRNRQIPLKKYPRLLLFYIKAFTEGSMGQLELLRFRKRLQNYQLQNDPIFVIGHWRSGTSFMQSLLGEAEGYQYYNKYQTIFPESFLSTRNSVKPIMNYIFLRSPIAKSWKKGVSHDFGSLNTASEIEVAQINQINRFTFHWAHVFPKRWKFYFDKYLFLDDVKSREYKHWLKSVERLNKKVSFLNPKDRLIVKNPGDTARVKHLLKLYPNAKFIFLYRNPLDVFYSNIKLWKKILKNLSLQSTEEFDLKRAILYIYRRVHERYFEDRSLLREDQLIEIKFEDFAESPLQSVKTIFDKFGLQDYEPNLAIFQKYLQEHPQKSSDYNYQTEDLKAIKDEWSEVIEILDTLSESSDYARALAQDLGVENLRVPK